MESDILQTVRDLIRDELGVRCAIGSDTDLIDDLHLDSMALLTLTVALENRFEVCLEPGPDGRLSRVSDVVAQLARGVRPAGGVG
jgi:acyl carrier protein